MLFFGRFITDFNNPKDLSFFEKIYGEGSDYVSLRSSHFGANAVRTLTPKDCKIIAVIEYDGDINNLFVFDKDDDEMKVFTNRGYDGNEAFNCDGSTFVQTTIDGKERHFMLENSPYSFKNGDKDYEGELEDNDIDVIELLANIRSYLTTKNVNFAFADEDVLFVRQL